MWYFYLRSKSMLDPVCLFQVLSQVLSQVLIGQGPTNRNQCSYSTIVHSTLFLTPLASGARVGARVEVKKNDLGKVSRIFFSRYQIGLRPWFSAVVHSDFLTWLTSAILRFFSLAEQCYTLIF